ncbi:PilX N-terminal [Psychrobacillus psychrotolerans]|uniref:PilX N-terminal n=1 Tax=Psychrobacillus psychrotolerans TaxID=126156 RepID=A0A1I5YUK9_9BACI|nr:PilX N-terminal domain-containing pilus assembly protein [Psychrobacillus psychrotolerans]SFQ47953.1 PilX N-terminal [Psychrobacillus psychrotolerans]
MKSKNVKMPRLLDASGFTLLSVLILVVIITVLGVSILTVTSNSLRLSANERTDQSTFYIAESGIVVTRKDMEDKLQSAYGLAYSKTKEDYKKAEEAYYRRPLKEQTGFVFDFAGILENYYLNKVKTDLPKEWKVQSDSPSFKEKFNFESNYSEDNIKTTPIATVTVTRVMESGEGFEYKIESVGKIGNKERTVSQKLIVKLDVGNLGDPGTPEIPGTPETPGNGGGPVEGLPQDVAIFVMEKIKILSPQVTGNIATLDRKAGSIEIGWNNTDNISFFVPNGSESIALKKPEHLGSIPPITGVKIGDIPKLPDFPIPPSYKIIDSISEKGDGSAPPFILKENSYIKKLDISGSRTLTIDVGETDKELVLDEFNISGDAKVIIKGTGKLTLHVKKTFNVTTSHFGSPSNNIEVFYSGSGVLGEGNIGGHTKIYASIYAETADVKIAGSTEIHGNILSGGKSFKVTGHGDVLPSLYFAPNAHFEVSGSGKVLGTIIGKSISVTGMGEVHYGEPQFNKWFPGIPSKPSTPGTPPTEAVNPNLTKRGPLIEN